MTTVLIIFLLAVMFANFLTPAAKWVGIRCGAMDRPDQRKIHQSDIPRTGGMAIFLSFVFALICTQFYSTHVTELLVMDRRLFFLLLGGICCMGIGVIDDFRPLGPKTKFTAQIVGASIAYIGGIRIGTINMLGTPVSVEMGSYFVTIFWFVLLINAINLIDGLDGLAGGVASFVAITMLVLSVLATDYRMAMFWAALAGACLGFLRYNFNPASIFLGDGGSYFIGYALAGLSILGAGKSQVGAALLIPVVALGVPLFDTLLSPLRRFVVGRKMFSPDKGHLHHQLVRLGLNTKRSVLIIYGVTVALCGLAVLMVNMRNEQAGMLFVLLGLGAFFAIQKLGYLEYLGADKFWGWLRDITDMSGISQDRRTFLGLQMEIAVSKDYDELWQHLIRAARRLKFDLMEMDIKDYSKTGNPEIRKFSWRQAGFESNNDICKDCLLKLELPLVTGKNRHHGTIWLVKDLRKNEINYYTLRRVEHLRRTIMGALGNLSK